MALCSDLLDRIDNPCITALRDAEERFQREEEIGKKLDHPGVMKVIANDGHHDSAAALANAPAGAVWKAGCERSVHVSE